MSRAIFNIGNKISATDIGGELWYGVEWDNTLTTSACTRIGNLDLHRSLPLQNALEAVLLNENGTLNYKLNPTNWDEKLGGGTAKRDGTDGDVLIWGKNYYFKYEIEGNIERWKISEFELPGFVLMPQIYLPAYRASLNRTTLKLASVVNNTADYRGGNNNAAWDAEDRSLLGMPATQLSRGNFRTYARNKGTGWQMYNWYAHFYLHVLATIEFANRNSQLAVNNALDASGFRQGGLGNGVTNINSTHWNNWNIYYPFIPNGYSDSLASGTGEVAFTMPAGYNSNEGLITYVNRYRGVELPFGHIWDHSDGCNVMIEADGYQDSLSKVYVSSDPATWNDANVTDMLMVGTLPRASGYIKQMIPGYNIAMLTGAGSTSFWSDYFYTLLPGSGASLRTLLLGGNANHGADAGFGSSSSNISPANTAASIGSRLCFMPA